MAKLFDLRDLRYWVYQPSLVRWRHRYKGVRESLKVNQEIGQTLYDINSADYRLGNLRTSLEETVDLLINGGTVDGVTFNWLNDATPGDEDLVIPGFDQLVGDVENLRNRVRRLEGN